VNNDSKPLDCDKGKINFIENCLDLLKYLLPNGPLCFRPARIILNDGFKMDKNIEKCANVFDVFVSLLSNFCQEDEH